jgi:hypothetical protein
VRFLILYILSLGPIKKGGGLNEGEVTYTMGVQSLAILL